MSWKRSSMSMPMASAGILGVSSDEHIAGIQVDPRAIVVGALIFVVAIKVLQVLFRV